MRNISLLGGGLVAASGLVLALLSLGPGDEPSTGLGERATSVLADPVETYDPVRAGETLPEGYRRLLRRDDIDPVYRPEFVTAEATEWDPETLVVGVAIDGEARAYPVNYLNVHEMINDRIAGTPVLVSW